MGSAVLLVLGSVAASVAASAVLGPAAAVAAVEATSTRRLLDCSHGSSGVMLTPASAPRGSASSREVTHRHSIDDAEAPLCGPGKELRQVAAEMAARGPLPGMLLLLVLPEVAGSNSASASRHGCQQQQQTPTLPQHKLATCNKTLRYLTERSSSTTGGICSMQGAHRVIVRHNTEVRVLDLFHPTG